MKYIIADNVKVFRKRKKLSQSRLAELSGLSLDSIKRVESGKITLSLENFLRIAEALDIHIVYLFSEEIGNLPEIEQIHGILMGRGEKHKIFLLHILRKLAEELDKL